MAIKGKKRSRPRGAALPPRPAVPARRTPLGQRRDVKRALVIVLSALAMLGGLRVWQNVSRSDAVREFNQALLSAQGPLLAHLGPDSLTNVETNLQQFTEGQMEGKTFLDLATAWETDFTRAKEAVEALEPPNDVSESAQELVAEGLDGYVGVARLYNVAAQLKQNAETESDQARQKQWEDKIQVVLTHAREWRDRADRVYTIGQTMFNELKYRYGIEPRPDPGTGL